jgi:DNA-binding PadR family transcriptional regulator
MNNSPLLRISAAHALLDSGGFEAETAALAVLANLKAEGPATARDLLRRIARAAEIAGEPVLPFKHATLYAVLHELEFDGSILATSTVGDRSRQAFVVTPRGKAFLALGQERWRTAHLVIRAAAAAREGEAR